MFTHDPAIWFKDLLLEAGLTYKMATYISGAAIVVLVIFLAWLSNLIAKTLIRTVVIRIVKKTTSIWDDIFLEQKVFTRLSHLAPALVIWFLAGWALKDYDILWLTVVRRLTYAYMLIVGAIVINSFIESWYRIYLTLPISQHRPIKGYVQIIKVVVVLIFSLLVFSVLFRKEVTAIIAGLGVMASVIILIFKDAILGLVASIQLSANKMVKVGDWITIPGRDIDGEVADITLTTVKVKNFDKTIVTVPTYSLVNESFQNWIGMTESGVRQIKRNIFIDMKSVRFADGPLYDKIEKYSLLDNIFVKSPKDGKIIVKDSSGGKEHFFSSGQLTNLGIFRMYTEVWLRKHSLIDTTQPVIVRHRPPEGNGMPLQVYAFTNKTDWVTYENVQSEIFEHLLAVLNDFDLKVFQQPTGDDLLSISKNKSSN
jgi:miniconductance mechanosensitive channel